MGLGLLITYKSSNNCLVELSNKTLSHIEVHPKIIDYIPEAISHTSLPKKQEDRIRTEIDLNKIVKFFTFSLKLWF